MPIDIDAAVAQAVRAPSSHNTQPWLFERADGGLRLYADRTRALPVNDPEDRELTMSCGAALMTLRVAAAAQGAGTEVTLLPEGEDSDLLATVAFGGAADPARAALAPAIAARHTHRGDFAAASVDAEIVERLEAAAEAEGAHLAPVDSDSLRAALADLVAEGDATQWADPRWRRELAMWMHPRRMGDGLAMPGAAVPVARFAVRHFDMGDRIGAQDAERARRAVPRRARHRGRHAARLASGRHGPRARPPCRGGGGPSGGLSQPAAAGRRAAPPRTEAGAGRGAAAGRPAPRPA